MAGLVIKNAVITEKKIMRVHTFLESGECDEIWLKNCTSNHSLSSWFYGPRPLIKNLLLDNYRSVKTCARSLMCPTTNTINQLTICNVTLCPRRIRDMERMVSWCKSHVLSVYDIDKDYIGECTIESIVSNATTPSLALDKMDADIADHFLRGFTRPFPTKWIGLGKHIGLSRVDTGLRRLLLEDESKELQLYFRGVYSLNFFVQLLRVLSDRKRPDQSLKLGFVNVKLSADNFEVPDDLPDTFHCDNLSVEFIGPFQHRQIVKKLAENKGATILTLPNLHKFSGRRLFHGKYPSITKLEVGETYLDPFAPDSECPQLRTLAINNNFVRSLPKCVLLTHISISQDDFYVNFGILIHSKIIDTIKIVVGRVDDESAEYLSEYLCSDAPQNLTTFHFQTQSITPGAAVSIHSGLTQIKSLVHLTLDLGEINIPVGDQLPNLPISNIIENNRSLTCLVTDLRARIGDLPAFHESAISALHISRTPDVQFSRAIKDIVKRNMDNQTTVNTSMLTTCLNAIERTPLCREAAKNAAAHLIARSLGMPR